MSGGRTAGERDGSGVVLKDVAETHEEPAPAARLLRGAELGRKSAEGEQGPREHALDGPVPNSLVPLRW